MHSMSSSFRLSFLSPDYRNLSHGNLDTPRSRHPPRSPRHENFFPGTHRRLPHGLSGRPIPDLPVPAPWTRAPPQLFFFDHSRHRPHPRHHREADSQRPDLPLSPRPPATRGYAHQLTARRPVHPGNGPYTLFPGRRKWIGTDILTN